MPPSLRDVTGPIRLDTERLVLREIEPEDWRAARAWDADPEVAKYMSFAPLGEAASRQYIEQSMKTARAHPRRVYELAIALKTTGEMIGRAAFNVERPEHADATAWYVVRRAEWGKGYVPEAVRALFDFAFKQVGVHRIWADCDPRNVGSWRVMEKVGMRREGHLKENWWLKGEWCDSYIYAITAGEWLARP